MLYGKQDLVLPAGERAGAGLLEEYGDMIETHGDMNGSSLLDGMEDLLVNDGDPTDSLLKERQPMLQE